MNSLDRIKQIETTTLTSVSLRGSHKMVSHDDFRFLIDQAKNANKEEYKNGSDFTQSGRV